MRTNTQNNAGKNPIWNETKDIDVKYIGDDMTITVFDENLTNSSEVASAVIKLSSFCIDDGIDEWFALQH